MRWWVWVLLAWVLLSVPAALLLAQVIRIGQGDDPCATCAHGRAAHEHYRAASDCALCDCPQYVRPRRQPRALRVPAAALRRVLPIPRRSPG